jgi:PKD repeat protein
VTGRQALCGNNAGHICSTLADSNGPVPTGPYGGLEATADTANATATTWSIVLRTQAANQAPTASFTFGCTSTVCNFDGTASKDPDGSIVSYAWDFGDLGTGTGATPSHDFGTSGSRNVTLTVTDDQGVTGSVTLPVSVVRSNANPTASFTASCTFLACSFDASASKDTDGSIASYAWDFGDSSTDTTSGPTDSHTYGSGGSRVVTLTVTDNDGGTNTTTRSISPIAAQAIALVGSSSNQGNAVTPNTTVPQAVSAGNRLVLVLSINDNTRTLGTPTGVTGWTLVDTVTSGTMLTAVYTKSAAASDAGKTARVPLDVAAKYTMTLAAYSGDMLAPQVVKSAETVNRTAHVTPTVQGHAGDWALSYWADKSSATTDFSLPAEVTEREAICSANAGHICSVLADSGGPISDGPYGGLTATADASSAVATMWTVILPRAG